MKVYKNRKPDIASLADTIPDEEWAKIKDVAKAIDKKELVDLEPHLTGQALRSISAKKKDLKDKGMQSP